MNINYLYILLLSSAFPINAFGQTDVEKELEVIKQRLDETEKQLAEKNSPKNNSADKDSSSKLNISGYAEVHYNNLDNKNPTGADKKELDAHRAVIEFEYHYSDTIRSEIEIEYEHAFVEDTGTSEGAVEVEQVFIEFTYDQSKLKLGQFILPVGILNKKHRPPAFYGVERNNVENQIIPTTWWEIGGLYHYKFSKNVSLDGVISSGLFTTLADDYSIRSGRQKGSKAKADDLAYLATLKWKISDTWKLGGSLQHQTDITQGTDPTAGSANLLTVNVLWEMNAYSAKFLYATWDLEGSGPASVGADEQTGWYLEPAYRINKQYGVFARYSVWDNQAGDSLDSEYSQIDIGLNYWPVKNIVIKADFQDQDAPPNENEFDGFNLGIGFDF